MQYCSGKSRIAKYIADVIYKKETRIAKGKKCQVVSLFCGTCAVESKLAEHFEVIICNDKQEYLIAMLNGVQNGYELPEKCDLKKI